MSSTSSDKIRWTKHSVFWNIQLNTGEWTIILFLPLLWLEMSTSGHKTQFSQPQVNPTRRWDRGNPTRPPTLSMLRGQRMEQRFTWDKHSTIEISHADYIFLYIMYHFHWQYNITYSIHKCIILGTVVSRLLQTGTLSLSFSCSNSKCIFNISMFFTRNPHFEHFSSW